MFNTRFRPVLLLLCLAAGAGRSQFLETVIPVGGAPTDVLWNSASNKVYVANSESGSVTVIDGVSNQVTATVAVAGDPFFLCWNPVANKVYCTSYDPDWLNVIDGVGDTVIRKVRMRGAPLRMAFNALMNKLYVICYDDQMVRVYDGSDDTLVAEVWLGSTPGKLLWHPVSNRVFCTTWCAAEDTVFVIDCATDEIAGRVHVDEHPYAMCWNPVNNFVYVSTWVGIMVLSAAGDTLLRSIPAYGDYMCFAPYPNKIYAARNWTYVIDCDSQTVSESLSYGGNSVVCDTVLGKVYSAARYRSPVFDARVDTLITTIPLGRSPQSICWNSTNSRVYINDVMDDVVYVIRDTSTGIGEQAVGGSVRWQQTATVTRGPYFVPDCDGVDLYSATGQRVAVLSPGQNSISGLPPGTYFVRVAYSVELRASSVMKVVLTE